MTQSEQSPEPTDRAASSRVILVSGASGLIGREVVTQLRQDGHQVRRLVRREPRTPDEVSWAPSENTIDPTLLNTVDAVINLSGAPLGRIPWTPAYKKRILQSRLETTRTLAEAIGRADVPPSTFLSASAVGIYGDRPGEQLPDGAPRGHGFLADVVEQWEDAAVTPSTTRVVTLRTGIVVGSGGALKPLLRVTRLGLGSRVASGGQHWPWISLYDEAAAIRHLLRSDVRGAVNLAGPVPATSDRLTSYLARKLHRPYKLVLPRFAVSAGMGEAGRELLLSSQQVVPTTLLADGFRFRHETVESAVDALLAR